MKTMYEKLMDLPIFKGVTSVEISDFLEHTPVYFNSYALGDSIAQAGDFTNCIRFVIDGEVRVEYEMEKGFRLSYICGPGMMIGAERLFGMTLKFPLSYVAASEKVSVFGFTKKNLLELLKSNDICLINTLNYLSFKAQRAIDTLKEPTMGNIMLAWLQHCVAVMTTSFCKGIIISIPLANCENLNSLLATPGIEVISVENGMFSMRIPDRTAFLEL